MKLNLREQFLLLDSCILFGFIRGNDIDNFCRNSDWLPENLWTLVLWVNFRFMDGRILLDERVQLLFIEGSLEVVDWDVVKSEIANEIQGATGVWDMNAVTEEMMRNRALATCWRNWIDEDMPRWHRVRFRTTQKGIAKIKKCRAILVNQPLIPNCALVNADLEELANNQRG